MSTHPDVDRKDEHTKRFPSLVIKYLLSLLRMVLNQTMCSSQDDSIAQDTPATHVRSCTVLTAELLSSPNVGLNKRKSWVKRPSIVNGKEVFTRCNLVKSSIVICTLSFNLKLDQIYFTIKGYSPVSASSPLKILNCGRSSLVPNSSPSTVLLDSRCTFGRTSLISSVTTNPTSRNSVI